MSAGVRFAAEREEVIPLRAIRPLVAILLAVCVVPLAWALPIGGYLGDAGTSGDAGDSRAEATPLAYGSYLANMTPFDADWFAFAPGGGLGCLSLSTLADHTMRVVLEAGPSSLASVPDDHGRARHLMAVGGHLPALVGFEPDTSYLEGAASVGPYAFSVSRAGPSAAADGPTFDARPDLARATPVPSECFSGRLDDDDSKRDVDTFSFVGKAGVVVEYSIALARPGNATLAVVNAANQTLGIVAAGSAASLTLPTDGTYYLRAVSISAGDDAPYVIGLLIGPDPPGSGCKPTCMAE